MASERDVRHWVLRLGSASRYERIIECVGSFLPSFLDRRPGRFMCSG